MTSYWWPKPGEREAKLKISYVRLLPGPGWLIGSGAWLEDITEEMKGEALREIGNMRQTDGNYFWINDTKPTMVMHPVRPDLVGKPVDGLLDAKGKAFMKEMSEVAKKDGQGFVGYYWKKPGKNVEVSKLSYVRYFAPWDWVLGMGVYTDDIDDAILARQNALKEIV